MMEVFVPTSAGSLLVLLLAIGCGFLAGCAHSPRSGEALLIREGEGGINVVAEGRAEARPDRARFTVGVETRRPTVAEARDANAAAQTRVLDALRAAGIASADIQTGSLSIQPEYQYTETQGQQLLGYTARNMVNVRMSALDRLSEAVDAAVAAGGNDVRLDGIQFEVSDPAAVRSAAREDAMTQARATAQQLATLAGVELGDPITIEEIASGGIGPMPMMRMAAAEAAQATPIEPGTSEVQLQLRVRWSIR
jgi:uncharacterized protein YggE